MLHLDVLGKAACGAGGVQLHSYTDPKFDLDSINCPECKGTLFFEAAERLVMADPRKDWVGDLLTKLGNPRITGALGDHSVLTEGMTSRERLQALTRTMSEEEKIEHLARIRELAQDTCSSCGGSIRHQEHSEDCLGPDPDDWYDKLTDEQIDAEFRVQGIDPVASKARFRETLDRLEQEALARLSKGTGGEYDPTAPYEPLSDEYWGTDES